MSTNTRLTIPMDNKLRTGLKQRADELGFDSSQALLRYVSKAIIEGRQVSFGEPYDDWGKPSPAALTRLNKIAEEGRRDHAAGKLKTYTTAEEALEHLHKL